MKASYRGISYETETPAIEATETQQTGIFLGNRFKMKQYHVQHRQPASMHLKYRGVDYHQ